MSNDVYHSLIAILNEKIGPNDAVHYGILRRSGRYPYGSGKDPYQHSADFLARIKELQDSGWKPTEKTVKVEFGDSMTLREYRARVANAKDDQRLLKYETVISLMEKYPNMSKQKIADKMGLPRESSVRSILDQAAAEKSNKAYTIAEKLREEVDKKRIIDVGEEVNTELGISTEKMAQSLALLKDVGYHVYQGSVPQATNPGKTTKISCLCAPDVQYKEIYDYDKIKSVTDYTSDDKGKTFRKLSYPESLDSKRLQIKYKEEGGELKDGLIEIRRGCEDLSLGNSKYAQLRVLVDGTHYIKGMGVYSDDLPPGIDIRFNTNKSKDVPMLGPKNNSVLKPIKHEDPDNPFGSLIKANGQYEYIGKDGKKHLSPINKTREEGDWEEWQNRVPSQFLSKQPEATVKKQLKIQRDNMKAEYDEIMSLTNPTIKKYYLTKFADECDKAATTLHAASFPGQHHYCILPVNSLSNKEVYAPGYKDGTELALVRYPHGGIFEIPILTVNNKNKEAANMMGKMAGDAIGINHDTAARLSGADFDGDSVMAIPTNGTTGVHIKNKKPLQGLVGWDPEDHYSERPGMTVMTKQNTQKEMGIISNLITDMTLIGADDNELERAVKHSMVVIDAEKHRYDYKKSEIDNNISELKRKYQDGGGASTIVSQSTAPSRIPRRQGSPSINIKGAYNYDPTRPEGVLNYKTAGPKDRYYVQKTYNKDDNTTTLVAKNGKKITYSMDDEDARKKYDPVIKIDPVTNNVKFVSKDGTIEYRYKESTQEVERMSITDNAYSLVSSARNPKELAYAEHANLLKHMAQEARKEYIATPNLKYNAAASKEYAPEVESLVNKIQAANANKPRERQAQYQTAAAMKILEKNNELSNKEKKKISSRILKEKREENNAIARRDRVIVLTDREWEAIQKGAISNDKMKNILNQSDPDALRKRAMPKQETKIPGAKISLIQQMANAKDDKGNPKYSLAEIAERTGVNKSTVEKYKKGEM